MTLLRGPAGPLLFRGSSSDGAFLLTGRRAFLDGHARMGVARVTGLRGEMIRALKARSAGCRRFRYSPGSLLRELEWAETLIREVVLVPRDLPGAAFQWSREGGEGGPPVDLAMGWRPGEGLQVSDGAGTRGASGSEGGHVLASLVDDAGRVRAFVLASEERRWRIAADGEEVIHTTALGPGESAQFAVVEADESGAPPGADLFGRVSGWERARAGDEAEAEETLFGAHAAGTDLRLGVAWARARLECPTLDRPSSEAAWLGLGGLCCGRFDVAREALATLARALDPAEGGAAEAHRLLARQAELWAGGASRDTSESPVQMPVPVGAPPAVLLRASLAARADPVRLARALCTLVAGTLGAQPDAPFGRLRLAPYLPSSWSALEVRNLRMGDVRVTLAYQREGHLHTFTLRQTAGAVPANLVFEPLVAEGDLISSAVDGEPADLEVVRTRGRVGVRLQLPLDAERKVALEGRKGP